MDRQKEFKLENALDFPLLSDLDGTVHKQFGTHRFGPLPGKRVTFVIGEDSVLIGKIASETNAQVHADEALDLLRNR